MKSFNENVDIEFDEFHHEYQYQCDSLIGATTYIKKYISEFDTEFVASNCERHWNVNKFDIMDAWSLSGSSSSSFGTGIHKALEFEDLYRSFKKPKDNSRCFLIKHPILNKIVQDFFKFYDNLNLKGEVIPEALISDVSSGFCGLADRVLVTSYVDRTCRLQDYKVNHSFDKKGEVKFKGIPKELGFSGTKLNKLSLQLKYHEMMLNKSGWTVEGFDGFIFEDEWKYYQADQLKGFDIITGKLINNK